MNCWIFIARKARMPASVSRTKRRIAGIGLRIDQAETSISRRPRRHAPRHRRRGNRRRSPPRVPAGRGRKQSRCARRGVARSLPWPGTRAPVRRRPRGGRHTRSRRAGRLPTAAGSAPERVPARTRRARTCRRARLRLTPGYRLKPVRCASAGQRSVRRDARCHAPPRHPVRSASPPRPAPRGRGRRPAPRRAIPGARRGSGGTVPARLRSVSRPSRRVITTLLTPRRRQPPARPAGARGPALPACRRSAAGVSSTSPCR
jgi:hypothetical protein